MNTLTFKYSHPDFSDKEINSSIESILKSNSLGAMSSINGSKSYVNTAYFVYSNDLVLYFLSQPTDIHVSNITNNSSVAVAIWETPDNWGENLRGLQLFGTCKQLSLGKELLDGMKLFIKKFPAFKSIIKHPGEFADGVASRMYAIRISSVKILDEPQFGRRKYITLKDFS